VGSLLAPFFATAKAALFRRLAVFGLWAVSGLLIIFATGYALDSLYTFLMFRWGAVEASVAVAAGLFLGAVAAVLAGYFLSRTPSAPLVDRLQHSLKLSANTKGLVRSKKSIAPAAGGALAGVVAAIATLVMLRRRRFPHDDVTNPRKKPRGLFS
jgi:hypothetical protein